MVTVKLAKGDTVISQDRLDMLLAKERAHDAYLWATKRMADSVRRHKDFLEVVVPGNLNDERNMSYAKGYEAALLHFAQLVVDAPPT